MTRHNNEIRSFAFCAAYAEKKQVIRNLCNLALALWLFVSKLCIAFFSFSPPKFQMLFVFVSSFIKSCFGRLNVNSMFYAPSKFGFYHAFIASLSVIIVSELGDKTWFIAAILAMRHSRLTVFTGAIAALAVMTVFSACLGWITQLIPHQITFYLSTALFAIFGLKMLHEAWHMSPSEGQEVQEEAQAEVQKTELDMDSTKYSALETGADLTQADGSSSAWRIISFVSTLFVKSFTLTFLAEWGDRSQLTTIVLGAREDVVGVILGGIIGHMICTGIAVLGGRLLAQRISVRTVTFIGGVVFLLFAFSAFFISESQVAADELTAVHQLLPPDNAAFSEQKTNLTKIDKSR